MTTEIRKKFNEECRELWRHVATGYSADGHYPERMKKWANEAVRQYRDEFESEIRRMENEEAMNK